jgi:5'-nucleotidase / UDP-sugar diphosphatase
VPIVTTSGNYEYLGRLVVHCDAPGSVVGWDRPRSGPPRPATRWTERGGSPLQAPDPWGSRARAWVRERLA